MVNNKKNYRFEVEFYHKNKSKMKNKKAPLSIRIIYVLTEISFVLSVLITLVIILFSLLVYTGNFKKDFKFHVNMPVEINVLDIGNFNFNESRWEVEIVEAKGKIHFIDIAPVLKKWFVSALLIAMSFLLLMMWNFRNFMLNIKKGMYFEVKNIRYLKYIAFTLLGLWIYTRIYMDIFYRRIVQNFQFEHIELTCEKEDYNAVLIAALFLYMLAHIFTQGSKLTEEAKLTI